MSRKDTKQKPPRPDLDLIGFPEEPRSQSELWRAHSTEFGAGFFANAGRGRFDLSGDRGTMYVADDEGVAAREYLGDAVLPGQVLLGRLADSFVVSVIDLPSGDVFADVSHKDSAHFDVVRELVTMVDYTVTNAWAERFDSVGYAGVRYASRFTTDPHPNAWAVFGVAGPDESVRMLTSVAGRRACEGANIRVSDPAPKSSYTMLTDI